VSIAAAVRRRSYEAAALGTVGIRRGQLYRAALTEQLLLLGTAVVVGVPAGLLALLLALPAVPQFSDDTPVPLALLPPALPIVLCAVALVVLVGATVLVSAGRVVRAGSTARLREAEE
jgi:putative ABC transport system permease protein